MSSFSALEHIITFRTYCGSPNTRPPDLQDHNPAHVITQPRIVTRVVDPWLRDQLRHVAERLASDDPARGRWCVSGNSAVIWTDASSVAAGVVLETADGDVIEDACWLQRDETSHINMAELDAASSSVSSFLFRGAITVKKPK